MKLYHYRKVLNDQNSMDLRKIDVNVVGLLWIKEKLQFLVGNTFQKKVCNAKIKAIEDTQHW